ncbi:MAG: MarR family transcriptional regulator, partial [Rhodococcus sp. (in: high G+C Gram-positive bacteria)]
MDSPRWLGADEQQAWRADLDATRLLLRDLDNQLTRDSGISFTDFELLVVLSE